MAWQDRAGYVRGAGWVDLSRCEDVSRLAARHVAGNMLAAMQDVVAIRINMARTCWPPSLRYRPCSDQEALVCRSETESWRCCILACAGHA